MLKKFSLLFILIQCTPHEIFSMEYEETPPTPTISSELLQVLPGNFERVPMAKKTFSKNHPRKEKTHSKKGKRVESLHANNKYRRVRLLHALINILNTNPNLTSEINDYVVRFAKEFPFEIDRHLGFHHKTFADFSKPLIIPEDLNRELEESAQLVINDFFKKDIPNQASLV